MTEPKQYMPHENKIFVVPFAYMHIMCMVFDSVLLFIFCYVWHFRFGIAFFISVHLRYALWTKLAVVDVEMCSNERKKNYTQLIIIDFFRLIKR